MSAKPRKPQTLIAIVTHQRSGSKWVGSMIRQLYRTISLGEAFSPDNNTLLSFRNFLSKYSIGDVVGSDIFPKLDEYFDEIRTYLGLYYTFDIMFNQMDWMNFSWRHPNNLIYQYLRNNNDIVISLIRDPKDIFISMKLLDVTKKAHFIDSYVDKYLHNNVFEKNIKLRIEEYTIFRDDLLSDRRVLSKAFEGYDNYIELNYADILHDPLEALEPLERVLRESGKNIGHFYPGDISPFPNLVKTPIDYGDLIENMDEVLAWPS